MSASFAWFGNGAHHPYTVAHSNDEGRYRHHFENVYPFRQSLALEWGAFADLSPESVAVWYQDSPEVTVVPDGARAESAVWDVFGPVPIPPAPADHSTADRFSTCRGRDARPRASAQGRWMKPVARTRQVGHPYLPLMLQEKPPFRSRRSFFTRCARRRMADVFDMGIGMNGRCQRGGASDHGCST